MSLVRDRDFVSPIGKLLERTWNVVEKTLADALENNPIGTAVFFPALEISEDEKNFIVSVELPGVKEDDIDVRIKDNMLIISGEKKQEEAKEGQTFYLVERRYGKFERVINLPTNVDVDNVEAKFENGILTLTLPKKPKDEGKKIQIKKG